MFMSDTILDVRALSVQVQNASRVVKTVDAAKQQRTVLWTGGVLGDICPAAEDDNDDRSVETVDASAPEVFPSKLNC